MVKYPYSWSSWSDIDDATGSKIFFILFPFPSLTLSLSLSPPPTTNPPSSVLLRRSADWHFDLSDATLEYSFSRGAAVLIVFADCNLIVRQRGNWKSVRERVSPILQNLPVWIHRFQFIRGKAPKSSVPRTNENAISRRGANLPSGFAINRHIRRGIHTLDQIWKIFPILSPIPGGHHHHPPTGFINRFESLHGYGFEKAFFKGYLKPERGTPWFKWDSISVRIVYSDS